MELCNNALAVTSLEHLFLPHKVCVCVCAHVIEKASILSVTTTRVPVDQINRRACLLKLMNKWSSAPQISVSST